MSSYPNSEVLCLVKELIAKLTDFKEGSSLFTHIENYIVKCIHNADSMVFLKKKDIDRAMASLWDKFIFHGFSSQANDLLRHYENFLPDSTPKSECENKLNIIKFLLCLAENPTKNLLENPEGSPVVQHEEEIDWPTYLTEGIERWSPPPNETSDSWSDDSESVTFLDKAELDTDLEVKTIITNDTEIKERDVVNYNRWKEKFFDSIQNGWYLKDRVYMLPESTNIDANIAICWDDFVEHSFQGLVSIKKSNIITEYCVLREIMWQCFILHNSFTYHFIGDQLLPKENVTIASVRPMAFKTFLHEFLPYIEILQEFRDFQESLLDGDELSKAPDTYRSYNSSLLSFIETLRKKIVSLEKEIAMQETTFTLLKLAHHFRELFRDISILKEIHNNVIVDVKNNSSSKCAMMLLYRLHTGLLHCVSKTELDIYLTLFLESLFKYFTTINTWLNNDTLIDVYNEFMIKYTNASSVNSDEDSSYETSAMTENFVDYDHCDWQMGFAVRNLDELYKDDSIFKLISKDVLHIGKNIHFLRLLKKLYLLDDTLNTKSLHEELIAGVLKEISAYFKYEEEGNEEVISVDDEPVYKFPVICPDHCKYPTEMDRLENLVDTSDGFLMAAFESFFVEQPKMEVVEEENLYKKISKRTKNLYPAKQIVDKVFTEILQERYSQSGYLVKNLLIVDFRMEKHFNLLKHLFLFKDDLIFPLYRKLFEQMERQKSFDNSIWLTTQLHDIMIDHYPCLYEKCLVKIDDATYVYEDPLKACQMIDVHYTVNWPVSLIINKQHLEMYSELFHLILNVKWALYTLNHLYFDEIESKSTKAQQPKVLIYFLRRLKIFRFHLLNEFSNIQHYILGYLLNKFSDKFERDFEEAYNLDTLITSHSSFINSIYGAFVNFRDLNEKSHGFNLLMYIVRKFHIMWKDAKNINKEELLKCETMFKKCCDNLDPLIFPRDLTIDV